MCTLYRSQASEGDDSSESIQRISIREQYISRRRDHHHAMEAPVAANIGSLAIDQYSQAALIDEILHHALCGSDTRQVVTANAQFYVLAESPDGFASAFGKATTSVPTACPWFGHARALRWSRPAHRGSESD